MKKGPGKIQTICTNLHYPHLTGRQPQDTNQRGIILQTPLRNQEAPYIPARKDVNKSSSTDLTNTGKNTAPADCRKKMKPDFVARRSSQGHLPAPCTRTRLAETVSVLCGKYSSTCRKVLSRIQQSVYLPSHPSPSHCGWTATRGRTPQDGTPSRCWKPCLHPDLGTAQPAL